MTMRPMKPSECSAVFTHNTGVKAVPQHLQCNSGLQC